MAVLYRGRAAVTVPDDVAGDYLADGYTTSPGPVEAPRDAEEAEPEGRPAPAPRRAVSTRRKAAQ